MQPFRRILVAVKEPDARLSPMVEKAIVLAKGYDAELELLHVRDQPTFAEPYLTVEALTEITGGLHAQIRAALDRMAEQVRKRGVRVRTRVEWDFPPYEGIVRRAVKGHADLIVAGCHPGRHRLPALMRLNDWELLRLSPVPLLLVKNAKPWRTGTILAALDPTHESDKPARLDRQILEVAESLSSHLHSPLHAMHAYGVLPVAVAYGDYLTPEFPARFLAQARAHAVKALNRTLRRVRIPAARRHVIGEHAVDAIPRVARRTHADIVVMGAISRSGLSRLIIGNTAERVLDSIPSDLLIVKPPGFRNRVGTKRRPARLIGTMTVP